MKRVAGVLVVVALVAAAGYWLLQQERAGGPTPFLGYVEAETILVSPKRTGRLETVTTTEGATVAAGQPLYTLDAEDEKAAVKEAEARLGLARARLADLHAARQRPEQIEVLEARRRQAQAALELSRAELERQQQLFRQKVIAKARLDQARTAYRRDRSALAQVDREIEAARLPGREQEIEAASAEVDAGTAALTRARVALADRDLAAPRAGRVLDVLYRVGEVVPAGQPVVEILPPENIIVRFYVPETEIARLAQGQRVSIACDRCPTDLVGKISFIASESEFTPPVIFSRQERAKLVFLVEARPTKETPFLKPGLPVEVRPQ